MLGIVSNSDTRVRSILQSLGVGHSRFSHSTRNRRGLLYPPRPTPNRKQHPMHDPVSAEFAFELLSYESRMRKSDPAVFNSVQQIAQEHLNSLPASWRLTRNSLELLQDIDKQFWRIHIGDSIDMDVIPALQAGWDGVLFDPTSSEPISERAVAVKSPDSGKQQTKFTVINSLHPDVMRQLVARDRIEQPFRERNDPMTRARLPSQLPNLNAGTDYKTRTISNLGDKGEADKEGEARSLTFYERAIQRRKELLSQGSIAEQNTPDIFGLLSKKTPEAALKRRQRIMAGKPGFPRKQKSKSREHRSPPTAEGLRTTVETGDSALQDTKGETAGIAHEQAFRVRDDRQAEQRDEDNDAAESAARRQHIDEDRAFLLDEVRDAQQAQRRHLRATKWGRMAARERHVRLEDGDGN